MGYTTAAFQAQGRLDILKALPKIGEANVKAKLSAASTALASDTRLHDLTIETPPAALDPRALGSDFQQALNILINRGIAGGLTQASMKTVIDNLLAAVTYPPTNVIKPHITSTALNVGAVASISSLGDWSNAPTSFTYQWTRGGTNIAGATASSYTFVSGDIGALIACVVTATNADGNGTAASNSLGPVTA